MEEITGPKAKNSEKPSWVQVSMKMLGLGIIINFSVIFNDTYRMIRPW
jgi:hypothetical protein